MLHEDVGSYESNIVQWQSIRMELHEHMACGWSDFAPCFWVANGANGLWHSTIYMMKKHRGIIEWILA